MNKRQARNIYFDVKKHIEGIRTIIDEYKLIMQKKSLLPKAHREWIVDYVKRNAK